MRREKKKKKKKEKKKREERTDCMNDDDEAYDAFVYISLLSSFFRSREEGRERGGEHRHIFRIDAYK